MSDAEDQTQELAAERDTGPIVERPSAGVPTGVIILVAVMGGILLFSVLEARRARLSAPATTAPTGALAESSAPPLVVPPEAPPTEPAPGDTAPPPTALAVAPSPPTPHVVIVRPQPMAAAAPPQEAQPFPPPEPARAPSGSVLVFDRGSEGLAAGTKPGEAGHPVSQTDQAAPRARAGMFANRATTVPQGTLIPAVLETGFDSTRPGSARALVQRDIRGFDGSRVLVPRGSRLVGEYESDATAGQNRALIIWTRLIRPDGGTIAISSPVTDTEGRTGARAHVNSHFLVRFSTAFLQTSLNVGMELAAARASNSALVLALPGSFQTTNTAVTPSTDIRPTLTVKPGTSISVLVARDLDFTDVEGRP